MNITVTGRPSNLRYTGNEQMQLVESDVFNVCQRIKELDPNLFVVLHKGHEKPFVVVEMSRDGEERMVKRYAELTPSILHDLQRMLKIPWEQRFKQLAREVDEHNEARENAWVESEAMERFAFDMRRALRDANMADVVEPVSMFRKVKK